MTEVVSAPALRLDHRTKTQSILIQSTTNGDALGDPTHYGLLRSTTLVAPTTFAEIASQVISTPSGADYLVYQQRGTQRISIRFSVTSGSPLWGAIGTKWYPAVVDTSTTPDTVLGTGAAIVVV